jgi:predicted PurR-regulated permease PerM
MIHNIVNDKKFLAWFTLAMIAASLWIFKSYLHFLLVAAVLALSTSHLLNALTDMLKSNKNRGLMHKNKEAIGALILTIAFLMIVFTPLLYFVSVTYGQVENLDIAQIKTTLTEMADKTIQFLDKIPIIQKPLIRIKQEGLSIITGPAIDVALDAAKGLVAGVGSLLGQVMWILIFYFLFNAYGKRILQFLAELIPMSYEHEKYLYRECTGTVAVVFYGTFFNMIAQGIAFGLLMSFVGDYSAVYLGVLTGFCSVIPIVGGALIYVPVVALELLHGNIVSAVTILVFAWLVMSFFIDNIVRLFFIGFLKKTFGFDYKMNEIIILLAILAGVASVGFWGLIIGPSVLALTLAAANLYSSDIIDQTDNNSLNVQSVENI